MLLRHYLLQNILNRVRQLTPNNGQTCATSWNYFTFSGKSGQFRGYFEQEMCLFVHPKNHHFYQLTGYLKREGVDCGLHPLIHTFVWRQWYYMLVWGKKGKSVD